MCATCIHVPARDRSRHLDELDAVLVRVRRLLHQPAYRRRLLEGLGTDVALGTLRAVRAVEQTGAGEPTIGEVAESLGIDPSTASRAVDDAVARGFVARRPCDDDRRRQRLQLTDAGRALMARTTTVRRGLLAEVTGDWDTAALATLVTQLRQLVDDFDRLSPGS